VVAELSSIVNGTSESANVSYQLVNVGELGSLFFINPSNGQISLHGQLDFETRERYVLTVVAMDGSGNSTDPLGTVQVIIRVLDVNDNAPQFSNAVYEIQIISAANGSFVLQVNVQDADSGTNGQTALTIQETNVPFSINSANGVITISGSINRETAQTFNFTVVATDGGNPPLTSTASVSVTLDGDNSSDAAATGITPIYLAVCILVLIFVVRA
jgi:hypothetical protein